MKNVEGFLKRFERYIVLGLLGMMVLVVFLATIELGVILVELQGRHPDNLVVLDVDEDRPAVGVADQAPGAVGQGRP